MFAALPPSSSVSLLPVPASSRWIALPTSVEPVKAILSTPSDFDERGARPAVAGDDVDDSRRQLGLASARRAKSSADSGVVSAGLRTTVLPGGERGRDLPRQHQQREVPRDDLARHADAGAGRRLGNAYSSLSAQPA
mgnify:CR=1 FL=1